MNLIKSFVVSLFTLFSVAQAQAPIINSPTSQNMEILQASKIAYTEDNIPVDKDTIIPIKSVYTLNSREIEAYIGKVFGSDAPIMTKIAKCESNLNQNAVSYTGDYGVFQINEHYWDSTAKELGLDYKNSYQDNIELAKVIHKQQGFSAWVCYNKMHE